MFRQTFLFGDEVVAKKILAAKTPGEAKMLGSQAGYAAFYFVFMRICCNGVPISSGRL
jgi:hypothetical protein